MYRYRYLGSYTVAWYGIRTNTLANSRSGLRVFEETLFVSERSP